MNAQEMYKALNTVSACDGLDKWIEHILFDRMQKSSNMKVSMDTKVVPYNQASFMREMRNLGYSVEYKCDDRPCASPYYEISIRTPSQPGL